MGSFEFVNMEIDEHVAVISMNRPPVNALNLELIHELNTNLKEAGENTDVRSVVITSPLEKAFCAGLDLGVVRGKSGIELRGFLEKLYLELYDVQYRLSKPSIAAVRGAARAGGMTIAVSCDMIIAGEGASFGYPEVNVGLVPALHFVHLPRIIGRHRAFELLFSGDSFSASNAASLGVINHVVPDEEVLDKALKLARRFARKSPMVMKLGRDAFMRANDFDYRRAIENVAETMAVLIETEDAQEGLNAFVEKRNPIWENK